MAYRENSTSNIGYLLLLVTIFYLNFMARVIISPLLPGLEAELNISHSQAASLFLYLNFGYFLALLGSGFLSRKVGHRFVLILSPAGIGLMLLGLSTVETLGGIKVFALFIGVFAGFYLPSGITTISGLFGRNNWGKAFGVHELAPNFAFLSAPLMVALLLGKMDWQQIMLILALCSLFTAIAYFFFGSRANFEGKAPTLEQCRMLFKIPGFWLMIFIFGNGIASTMGVYNLLPLFLVSKHGMAQESANTLISFSRVATIITALIGGWLVDRYGPRRTMFSVLCITGLLTVMLSWLEGLFLIIAVLLQPILAVCFFPAGFTTLVNLVATQSRNVVVSLTIPFAVLFGGGVVPAVVGFLADNGYFREGITGAGLLMIVAGCLSRLRMENRQGVKAS